MKARFNTKRLCDASILASPSMVTMHKFMGLFKPLWIACYWTTLQGAAANNNGRCSKHKKTVAFFWKGFQEQIFPSCFFSKKNPKMVQIFFYQTKLKSQLLFLLSVMRRKRGSFCLHKTQAVVIFSVYLFPPPLIHFALPPSLVMMRKKGVYLHGKKRSQNDPLFLKSNCGEGIARNSARNRKKRTQNEDAFL